MGAKDHTRRPMSAAHLAARLNMSARAAFGPSRARSLKLAVLRANGPGKSREYRGPLGIGEGAAQRTPPPKHRTA